MEGMSESNVKMMRLLVKSCWWVNNSLFTLDQLLIISSVLDMVDRLVRVVLIRMRPPLWSRVVLRNMIH